jgi:DNA invertase Pin-like site-specific DNA recombinase
MRVAIYARVSTQLMQNPQIQIDALREIAKNKGWEVCYEYVDRISGSKSSKDRTQLNQLMQDAVSKRFDCVMIYSLDRLARSVEHFVNITNELTALQINIFSMRESIDMTTPTGRAFAQMIAVVAELEKNIIAERVSLGVRNAIAKKGTWGRKSNLTPQVKENVISLKRNGVGIRAIATQNKIGVQTVYNILKTERVA